MLAHLAILTGVMSMSIVADTKPFFPAGETAFALNRDYERDGAAKEETVPHTPVKVSG